MEKMKTATTAMTSVAAVIELYGAVEGSTGVRAGSLLYLIPPGHALLGHVGEWLGTDPDGQAHYVGGVVTHREKSMSGLGIITSPELGSYSGSPALSVSYPGSADYCQRLIKTQVVPDGYPVVVTEIDQALLDASTIEVRVLGAKGGKVVKKGTAAAVPAAPAEDPAITYLKTLQATTKKPAPAAPAPPAAPAGFPNLDQAVDAKGAPLVPGDALLWLGTYPVTFVKPGVEVGSLSYLVVKGETGVEQLVNSAALVKVIP